MTIKCPVCKGATGGYYCDDVVLARLADRLVWRDAPLFQFSYPGEPEYISGRCLRCIKKAIKKAENKKYHRTRRMLKLSSRQSRPSNHQTAQD